MERFRFSVRTLAIFVTLACVYFGAWEATKKYGVERERHNLGAAASPAPFIIRYDFDEPIGMTVHFSSSHRQQTLLRAEILEVRARPPGLSVSRQ